MSEPKPQYRPSIHPGRMIEHLQLPGDAVIVEAKLTLDNITDDGKTTKAIDYTWSFQEAQRARRGRLRGENAMSEPNPGYALYSDPIIGKHYTSNVTRRRQRAIQRARKQRPRTVQPVKRYKRPGMFTYIGRPSIARFADSLGLRLNLSGDYQEPEPPKPQKVFVRFYKRGRKK